MNSLISLLDTAHDSFDSSLDRLLTVQKAQTDGVDAVVRDIVGTIEREGDLGLLRLTAELDRFQPASADELELKDFRCHLHRIPSDVREALEASARRIRHYHAHQKLESWEIEEADGTVLGQRITPLERVGIYVPGGKAAYPSSVLMNAIPAKVAGVDEIVMVVPAPGGEVESVVLAAATIAGVDRVFRIGGAQAVAALAYGTETIPAVDKIVGPGNMYVARAKAMVFGLVGIDMIAGPSEILIVSDGSAHPDWMAMDLFSQAEHDELAQAILLSPDQNFIDAVATSIGKILPTLERADIVRKALSHRGALIKVRDLDEAFALVNRIAPEHLEIALNDATQWLDKVRHAGAIFLGNYSPEALGDYCAGPNHVLPTSGTARFSSPLGVYDFQKRSSVIACSPEGSAALAAVAGRLADSEGLGAHARSARFRAAE